MKDGTGGDPFADDPIESESEPETDSMTETTSTTSETSTSTDSESSSDLPYIYSRDTVKEGRDQVPFFLRDHVQDLEDEFIEELEERLDTNVYKADAREAALEVVFESYVAETADRLREWGYDR